MSQAHVWTANGWRNPNDLMVGEKTISFNPDRNCTEYDEISRIDIDYKEIGGMGIYQKGMRQLLTPDHPILIWHNKKKELQRLPIESRFMGKISGDKCILYNSMFEPYKRTQEIEDIKWSARTAATYAVTNKHVDMWNIIRELGGYESQIWLDTFFHWNQMLRSIGWQYAVRLPNHSVRDMIFHVAPRAGMGSYWSPPKGFVRTYAMYLSTSENIRVSSRSGWVIKPINALTYNLATKNGNFLARSNRGNFLVACDYKGE